MLPKWCDEYSIDNPMIDEQHKKLFELAGAVEDIAEHAVSKRKVKELLSDFFHYMRDHFSDEEKYMESINYPELEPHRKIHKEIGAFNRLDKNDKRLKRTPLSHL